MDFSIVIEQATPLILNGMRLTLYVSIVSLFFGMLVGLFSCLMRMSRFRILRWIAGIYVWIIRGTPMLIQALFFFFGANQLISIALPGFRLSVVTASILTVSLNAGAYFTEIFRSGIGSVPKGQTEAAYSLGLTKLKTLRKIVFPQAFRVSLPPMVNQCIISIKDTSLLSVIGLGEMTNAARIYVGGTFRFFETYIYLALFYLVILSILMFISQKLEGWINYDRKN